MNNLFTNIAHTRICDFLDDLNEGRKKKFRIQYILHEQGHYIYCAVNKDKEVYFTALTDTGELPKDMATNWRIWSIIKEDFKIK